MCTQGLILIISDFVTFPLDYCDKVKDIYGNEYAGITLTDPTSTEGPSNYNPGYEAIAFHKPNSSLTIPVSTLGCSINCSHAEIRVINVNIRIDSFNQNKRIMEMVDTEGNGVFVTQEGDQLKVHGRVKDIPDDDVYLFNITLNTWHAFKFTVDQQTSPDDLYQFLASMDGYSPYSNSTMPKPAYTGNFRVFSFDGALSCLTFTRMDERPSPAGSLNETKCAAFGEIGSGIFPCSYFVFITSICICN